MKSNEHRALPTVDGTIAGPIALDRRLTVRGTVDGNMTVHENGQLKLYGMVAGDLHVMAGGEANIYGIVTGSILNEGRVSIEGMVLKGIRSSPEAQTYVAPSAKVTG